MRKKSGTISTRRQKKPRRVIDRTRAQEHFASGVTPISAVGTVSATMSLVPSLVINKIARMDGTGILTMRKYGMVLALAEGYRI
jgi:hypothetical protein